MRWKNSINSPDNDRDEIRGEFLPIPVIFLSLAESHQKLIKKRCQHLRRSCEKDSRKNFGIKNEKLNQATYFCLSLSQLFKSIAIFDPDLRLQRTSKNPYSQTDRHVWSLIFNLYNSISILQIVPN